MRLVALWAASTWILRVVAQTSTDPGPWGAVGQLGAAGVLAGFMWVQLQKAEKRADAAEARALAAYQETVPVLALATERLSEKVSEPRITPEDVRLAQVIERIEKKLGGGLDG